jgi:hypothetical protein
MIEHDFCCSEGTETIQLSSIEFELNVETFDGATGNGFLGTESIGNKLLMIANHLGHTFYGHQYGIEWSICADGREVLQPNVARCNPRRIENSL